MTLVRQLSENLIEVHPQQAAAVLERMGVDETARLLERSRPASGVALVSRLSPQFAAAALSKLDIQRCAKILDALDHDLAARLLRRLGADLQAELLERISPKHARSIGALLRFPENTAGALMDPEALALPQDFTAREALKRIRETPQHARYNVYVVDGEQRLVGVLNLRELLLAQARAPLSAIMVRDPQRLPATADRAAILAHPGWKDVHSLPVIDQEGSYLGAIRYRALRELEAELFSTRSADEDASHALGQLFAAGAGALLDALSGPVRTGSQRDS
jgi:magnesium transporter